MKMKRKSVNGTGAGSWIRLASLVGGLLVAVQAVAAQSVQIDNDQDTVEARYIEMSTRATFEPFVIATSSAETKKEIDELAAEAGIEFHYDQIPRLLMENMLTSIKGMDQPMPGVFEPNGVCPAG